MKRFLSLLLTVAMLTTMFATMVLPASATEGEGDPFYATFDTVRFTDGAYPVIIVADTADVYYYHAAWVSVSFKPTSEANTYEVVEGPAYADLAVPENGFVWTAYEYTRAAEIVATRNILRGFTPGDIITLNGVDFANKTVAENATIEYTYGIVAYGKSYTTSEPFRMGGADVNWGWDASKDPTYPDEDGVSLSDGSRPNARAYGDSAWTGIHSGTPDAKEKGYTWVTVDLAGNYNLTKISAYVAPNLGSGVSYAKDITFVVIDEEGNETVIKTITDAELKAIDDASGNTCAYIEASVDCDVVASKIEIRMTAWGGNGGFTFISEVAAYGVAYVAPEQGGESTDDEVGGEEEPTVGTMENPAQITLGVGESTTITVGAGSDYYFNLTLPQFGVGYILTVTGNTGFRYGTGMGMPIPDTNGSYSAQVGMPRAASGIVINTTAEEQTYTLTLSNLPAGSSYDNPEIITDNGDYKVTEVLDQFQGYFYQFTAPSAGTITVSMNDVDGWTYSITNTTTSVATDQHWCDDDPVVSYEKMEVAEGDVIIIVVNAYNSVDTEVNWNFAFEAAEVYNYAMSDTLIQVGTNDYTVDASYPYTVFTFAPDEVGKYTISSSNAVMGIVSYNGMWITIEPSAETVTESSIVWECLSEGQSIWIAVMADTNAATIAVSKEDVNIEQPTLKDYENIETPEDFEFDGDVDELEGVDYEDDVIDTAVLGDDGYYHLNSAYGPIIYVNLNDEMLSLIQAASYGQLSYTDLENNTKIDFTDAFQEYVDAAGESAIYPLTADLMEILKKVCEQRGWASFFGTENEDVWMALCYTMPESDVEPPVDVIVGDINGNGKIDARDYLLLKRAYFGTYTLTCAPEAADINGNGKIDARDYLLLKRAYFGTYTIAE